MRKVKIAAAIAATAAAVMKGLDIACELATRLLMLATGLDYGRAAARAPLVCGMAIGIIGLLCMYAWYQIEEEREQRRKYIQRKHARTEEPEYRQNRRGA